MLSVLSTHRGKTRQKMATHLYAEGRGDVGKGVLNQGHRWEVCSELGMAWG